jgi:hypothetical protein
MAVGENREDEPAQQLLVPIRDASLRQIVGGHLALDPVAFQHPNVVLAHLAGEIRVDLVFVL